MSGRVTQVFLARYAFDGDPDVLEAGYRRLLAGYPPELLDLQIAVRHAAGLDVYDACPDEQTFAAVSSGPSLRAATGAAGLPAPTVTGLGTVVQAVVGGAAGPARAALAREP